MIFLLLLFLIRIDEQVPAAAAESRDGSGTAGALMQIIEEVMEGDSRPWAKPITEMDSHRIQDLVDRGILVFHRALWFVEKDDGDE